MTETTILQNNAIVRDATVGATPPHGAVKTGELPLVHVNRKPSGPQVLEGQQKPVQIMPSRESKADVSTGGLPLIAVKMTQNGPQLDDGQDNTVVIKNKRGAVNAGGLPLIDVKMTQAGPQVHTIPNVQDGPPQIPAALPALSAPRQIASDSTARRGYAWRSGGHQTRAVPVRGPVKTAHGTSQGASTEAFSVDQLMLCRHLLDKHLSEIRAIEGASDSQAFLSVGVLAETALQAVDAALKRMAAEVLEVQSHGAPAGAPPTQAAVSTASISPAPSVAHVAGRVDARSYVMAGARGQRNAGMAPRSIARGPQIPLPPVIVKMEGPRGVVKNAEEVQQAREAVAAAKAEQQAGARGMEEATASSEP